MTKLTVLIVEDSPEDREFIRCALARDPDRRYTIVEEEYGAPALAYCAATPPDCVLLDYRLPDMEGVDFLMRLKGEAETLPCAVVVLTGAGNETIAVEVMKQGAQDYLIKGRFSQDGLRRALLHAVERVEIQQLLREQRRALQEANEQLERRVQERTVELVRANTTLRAEIAERRRMEEELRTFHTELERRVQEQTEQLRQSEERYRLLFEIANEGIWLIDPEGRTIVANTRMAAMLECTPEEMTKRHVTEFAFPEDIPATRERIANNLRGQTEQFDFRFRNGKGEEILVLACTCPARDRDGRIIGALGMFTDTTKPKRAEEALRESERRFRALANAVPAMVWTAAPDGSITYANDQWLQYCGVAPELNRKEWPQLVLHPDDRERCVQQWEHALASGANYEIEVRNRRHDGVYHWFLTRAVPARDELGRITRWHGTTMDIDDRKRLEDDLARQADELRRVNADLKQFAYICAHHLQEPVRMVALYSTLLAQRYQGKLDARAEEYLATATGGAKRLHHLLDDLLVYTELETGARPPEATDCETLLTRVLHTPALRQEITTSGAVITHDLLPTVKVDARQFALVFRHLLENALTFSNGSSPRVHLSAARPGAYWRFSVRDNGIGIAPDHTERIFRMFERLHPREHYSGTGMGLAICKKVIERHGGRIWVESTPGVGSTFYFTIAERS